MMSRFALLTLALLASAPAHAADLTGLQLKHFDALLGFSRHTSCQAVLKMFGEPQHDHVGPSKFDLVFTNSRVQCHKSSFGIQRLDLHAADTVTAAAKLRRTDKALGVFGARKYQLVRAFGSPVTLRSHHFLYKTKAGTEVHFYLSGEKVHRIVIDFTDQLGAKRRLHQQLAAQTRRVVRILSGFRHAPGVSNHWNLSYQFAMRGPCRIVAYYSYNYNVNDYSTKRRSKTVLDFTNPLSIRTVDDNFDKGVNVGGALVLWYKKVRTKWTREFYNSGHEGVRDALKQHNRLCRGKRTAI